MTEAPPRAQQQPKTVDGTARSFFKGGMGLVLQNMQHMLRVNQRNVDRFQAKLARGIRGSDGVPEPDHTDDAMRIDSDDIHNHYHQQREGMGTLAKLAAIALAATGIGVPASIAATQLPVILELFRDNKASIATPEQEIPDEPSLNINGKDYELSLDPE